jgi:two-component system, chemotaxis family, CheB/CheR fusion protein
MPDELARPVMVLQVDDDRQLGASMSALLRAHGCEVLAADDGPTALARLAQPGADPDVLIMDFFLPGDMDGADVAQEIRRRLGRVVPTIFLSGHLPDMTLPWLPGTPLLFASKPLDPEILVKVVGSFALLGRFMRSRRRRAAA